MRFCFVILHYKTANDTIECIESIQRQNDIYPIVIVDNHSNNGSIEKVEEQFSNFENIHIIKNKENLGFASGNNVGYIYAKEKLKADFIAILNNDIVIDTPNLPDRIMTLFKREQFHVLGPDIQSLTGNGHQNPMKNKLTNSYETSKEIIRYRILIILSKMGFYEQMKSEKRKKTGKESGEQSDQYAEDVMLHGSFMVFSPDFIEREERAFREGTFLYMEEAILRVYCSKKKYRMVYYPEVKVFHKEDSSTNAANISNKSKREFVFKNMIQSLKVYRSFLTK